MAKSIKDRLARAKVTPKNTDVVRGKTLLDAWVDAQPDVAAKDLANGDAARQVGHIAMATRGLPGGLACKEGCAFCCILSGEDGGLITDIEARGLHTALAPLAGEPDGSAWHPDACPSLDPDTRMCRAYDARPMICRSYISPDADACEEISKGNAVPGPGVVPAYTDYLTAHAFARAALGPSNVPTYSLKAVAAGAVAGRPMAETLDAARHKPKELEAERKRVSRG